MPARASFFNILVIAVILILLIFISGQEGCSSSTAGTRTGIDFTLIEGVSLLTPGDTLEKNEAFVVGVHIENYNAKENEGIVCVRDNLADGFSGIPSEGDGDCQSFSVRASESTEDEQFPGEINLHFPEAGQYSYKGLPELNQPFEATLFVSMQYQQESQITGTVTSPDETQPEMSQDPQPIKVSVEKSIFKTGDNYQINLEVTLKNSENAEIYTPDFVEKDKIYFNAEMKPLSLQCTDVNGNPLMGLIEFKNEKVIKCYALTSSKTQQSYPFVITLDYGVSLDKEYSFGIKTK